METKLRVRNIIITVFFICLAVSVLTVTSTNSKRIHHAKCNISYELRPVYDCYPNAALKR